MAYRRRYKRSSFRRRKSSKRYGRRPYRKSRYSKKSFYKKGYRKGKRGKFSRRKTKSGTTFTRAVRRVARSLNETHTVLRDFYDTSFIGFAGGLAEPRPIYGLGQQTYSLRWEGDKPDGNQGLPYVTGLYNPNRFVPNEEELPASGVNWQDASFEGNKVFIKGFSVTIDVTENLKGQHDGFDGKEYYRIMMLQNGVDPYIPIDAVNDCFNQPSFEKPFAAINAYDEDSKFEVPSGNAYPDNPAHYRQYDLWVNDVPGDGSQNNYDPDGNGVQRWVVDDTLVWDPKNFLNTYALNSRACTWNKRNSRAIEKSHDTGWIQNKVMMVKNMVLVNTFDDRPQIIGNQTH